MDILRFATLEQAALWSHEITGQLSDGHWENSRPGEHWEAPCRAQVIIDPNVQGRNFPVKRTYNFLASALLDVVQYRMIVLVKMARAFGLKTARMISDNLFEFKGEYDAYHYVGKSPDHWLYKIGEDGISYKHDAAHYDEIRKTLDSITDGQIMAALNVPYSRKDLRRDIRAIKKAFDTVIN